MTLTLRLNEICTHTMKAVSVHVIVIDRQRGRGRAPTPPSSVPRPSRMPVCGGLLEPRDSTCPVTQRLCSTQLWKMSLARRGPSQAGLAVPAVAQAPCCINEKRVTKGGSNLPKVTDLSEYLSRGHIAVAERGFLTPSPVFLTLCLEKRK